ncbi:hypothetical protein ACPA9J_28000 [Pseudomonas aeruginosa]
MACSTRVVPLLALHRQLKARPAGCNYDRHMGGAWLACSAAAPARRVSGPALTPAAELIERLGGAVQRPAEEPAVDRPRRQLAGGAPRAGRGDQVTALAAPRPAAARPVGGAWLGAGRAFRRLPR